ncbi:sugar phosphate isomerase/epimerase family protein [Halanaerobium kushneri]|uniref:Xylose isomerase n=1 Tax=Halanaerobium kushneri TaxID=56779 RepID=A0A1N6SMR1_9FIRM|nr:sugar phosphate isomerase/epimerase family protein [Halanaerobium kushneri]SIQ42405.1 xylose isomerase [Halanaerobium kushneri]
MKLATRINSFLRTEKNVLDVFEKLHNVDGLNYVDLNYPEHFDGVTVEEVKKSMEKNGLKLNGLALRFKDDFINGELANKKDKIADAALNLCKEAIDLTEKLGGSQITIWLGYDGFDYSFQINYSESWKKLVKSFQTLADYNRKMDISIEYKPYEPRSFSLLADAGTTLLMLEDIDKDNFGITLDFCHMLMKGENPAYGLDLAFDRDKLFGIHLNDGHGLQDDGMIVGSVNFIKTLEFLYYVKKYNYKGIIYFDTFPIRESAMEEADINVKMINKHFEIIEKVGMKRIENIIEMNDAVKAQRIFLEALK